MRKLIVGLMIAMVGGITSAQETELDVSEIAEEGLAKLKNFNTGAALDIPGLGKTMTDLIPNLQIKVGDGDISEDGELNRLGIVYSPQIENLLDFGVTVDFEKPDTYGVFEEESLITAEESEAIAEMLGFDDSIEYGLSFSYIGELFGTRFGRTLGLYQDTLDQLTDLAQAAVEYQRAELQSSPMAMSERRQRLSLLDEMDDASCGRLSNDLSIRFNQAEADNSEYEEVFDYYQSNPSLISNSTAVQQTCLGLVDDFIRLSTAIELQLAAYVDSMEVALGDVGVYQLTSMVAQQPQLVLNIAVKNSSDFAGPNEFTASLNYEWSLGGGNLNDFSANLGACGSDDIHGADAVSCVSDIRRFMTRDVRRDDQFRAAITGEFARIDDLDVDYMDPAFQYMSDREDSWSLTGALYWQKYLSALDESPIVFEGALQHSNADGAVKNDQNSASLSATKNIGGVNWTTAVIWSDEPEFKFEEGEDGVKLTLGFNYKL